MLPVALSMDETGLNIRVLEISVSNETFFPYVESVSALVSCLKHGYWLVNKILFIFFTITIASPLPRRLKYKTPNS